MEAYGDASSYNLALENAEFTLYLDSTDGSCTGNVGLNSYWAEYILDGDQLSFPTKQVAITQLWINEVVKQQQDTYLSILLNSDTCEVIDGKLHITGGERWIIFYRQ
jgi:heat shock protein HslJ